MKKSTRFWFRLASLLLLLTAVGLRLYLLPDAPPGLTHDEADHGITAWGIVNGQHSIYFTIGYGREPLYDYATALLMLILGPTYLAGRLTAVFFSLILLTATTAWVRQAFDRPTALLTLAGLSVSFWPLMTSRQALRSETLPALFALAVFFYWWGINQTKTEQKQAASSQFIIHNSLFLLAGLCLGLTFYTYIPARILWGVFPALLLYWGVVDRGLLRRVGPGTAVMLLIALLVSTPLWLYLANNPGTEVRINELSAPLSAAAAGDWSSLLDNVQAGWGTIAGTGDGSWRYNLPERPFLPPLWAILFYAGLAVSIWRALLPLWRRRDGNAVRGGAYLLAIAWLVAGISPVLVTGPRWSVTQAIGMQPVLYLFPALALRFTIYDLRFTIGTLGHVNRRHWRWVSLGLVALLVGGTAVFTARDYFGRWANAPQVRVQYETMIMAAMDYLNEYGDGAAAVSTITPGPFHTPALAQLTLHNEAVQPRWFDGRESVLLPAAEQATWLRPGFTPVPAALQPFWAPLPVEATLPLRATDEDRPLTVYAGDRDIMQAAWQEQVTLLQPPVPFETAVFLLGFELVTPQVAPGETAELVTLWQLESDPPDLALFVHVQGADGVPVAQAVGLGAPSALWQAGDWLVQRHAIVLPPETAVGVYPLAVGICIQTTPNCSQRLTHETGDLIVLPIQLRVVE